MDISGKVAMVKKHCRDVRVTRVFNLNCAYFVLCWNSFFEDVVNIAKKKKIGFVFFLHKHVP